MKNILLSIIFFIIYICHSQCFALSPINFNKAVNNNNELDLEVSKYIQQLQIIKDKWNTQDDQSINREKELLFCYQLLFCKIMQFIGLENPLIVYPLMGPDFVPLDYANVFPINNDVKDFKLQIELKQMYLGNSDMENSFVQAKALNALLDASYQDLVDHSQKTFIFIIKGVVEANLGKAFSGEYYPPFQETFQIVLNKFSKPGDKIVVLNKYDTYLLDKMQGIKPIYRSEIFPFSSFDSNFKIQGNSTKAFFVPDVVIIYEVIDKNKFEQSPRKILTNA